MTSHMSKRPSYFKVLTLVYQYCSSLIIPKDGQSSTVRSPLFRDARCTEGFYGDFITLRAGKSVCCLFFGRVHCTEGLLQEIIMKKFRSRFSYPLCGGVRCVEASTIRGSTVVRLSKCLQSVKL